MAWTDGRAPGRAVRIGIVGPGRLGRALAVALVGAGYEPPVVAARRPEAAQAIVDIVPGVRASSLGALVEASDLVFLTVPDAAIEAVAGDLASRGEQAIVHTSGALGVEVLASATARGAAPGGFHPLQTFPAGESPDAAGARFRGIVCGVEGAGALGEQLAMLAADLGGTSVRLEGVDRARYHAAAVLASNDVIALMAAAARAWASAGLDAAGARAALAPLMTAAAENVRALPLADALTGPIARGDVATVARHVEALAADASLSELYRALGRELLALELGHDAGTTRALAALLGPASGA